MKLSIQTWSKNEIGNSNYSQEYNYKNQLMEEKHFFILR